MSEEEHCGEKQTHTTGPQPGWTCQGCRWMNYSQQDECAGCGESRRTAELTRADLSQAFLKADEELCLAHRKISDDRVERWSMRRHLDVARQRLAEYEANLMALPSGEKKPHKEKP